MVNAPKPVLPPRPELQTLMPGLGGGLIFKDGWPVAVDYRVTGMTGTITQPAPTVKDQAQY